MVAELLVMLRRGMGTELIKRVPVKSDALHDLKEYLPLVIIAP